MKSVYKIKIIKAQNREYWYAACINKEFLAIKDGGQYIVLEIDFENYRSVSPSDCKIIGELHIK